MLLIHGGGWKKLENLKISNKDFCDAAQDTFGSCSVHNYYGMVEQTGSIFLSVSMGKCMHLHFLKPLFEILIPLSL